MSSQDQSTDASTENKAVLFADTLGFASLIETIIWSLDRIRKAERPLSWSFRQRNFLVVQYI